MIVLSIHTYIHTHTHTHTLAKSAACVSAGVYVQHVCTCLCVRRDDVGGGVLMKRIIVLLFLIFTFLSFFLYKNVKYNLIMNTSLLVQCSRP